MSRTFFFVADNKHSIGGYLTRVLSKRIQSNSNEIELPRNEYNNDWLFCQNNRPYVTIPFKQNKTMNKIFFKLNGC